MLSLSFTITFLKNVAESYKYKYNGKEYQDELSLNWYDYHARNYDPTIGRWMNMDPLAEITYEDTPYNYTDNNPVNNTDPDGMLTNYSAQAYASVNEMFSVGDEWRAEYENAYIVELPELEVGRSNYFSVGLGAGLEDRLQYHVYSNSPFHQYVRDEWSARSWDSFQSDLDWIGAAPVLGEPVDLINAGISGIRGRYREAGLSLAAQYLLRDGLLLLLKKAII